MEISVVFLFSSFLFVFLPVSLLLFYKQRIPATGKLPPGYTGLPFIGESLAFLSTGQSGSPQKFVRDRMSKFSRDVFKTSLFLEPTAVFCGPAGNKFLFSNEAKLVAAWWPRSVRKIFPSTHNTIKEAKRMRSLLPSFFKPEALQRYVGVMDEVAARHFAAHWDGRAEVGVYRLAKRYTFAVACRVFLSMDDDRRVERFSEPFDDVASGIMSVPVDFPGTGFHRGIKASETIRGELREVIRRRKAEGTAEAMPKDILTHMLAATDEEGRSLGDESVADKILGLLIGGHDTASSAITFIVKYLAEQPEVYNQVFNEQMEIAKAKGRGELLTWEDLQRMKYSWNVICEVMRLSPPLPGAFREAITDFTFAGFSIPKGWKLYWSTYTTHRSPEWFPEPEKFDPTRFEGQGPAPYTYVPFGGGPRMCPGREYARLEMLVFLHHVVRRFRWEKLLPGEGIIVDPLPMPTSGLPVGLRPHPPPAAAP